MSVKFPFLGGGLGGGGGSADFIFMGARIFLKDTTYFMFSGWCVMADFVSSSLPLISLKFQGVRWNFVRIWGLRWRGDSQRESRRFARIDSRESIRRKNPYFNS